jgi:putative ABC transport system permease protein
LLDVITFRGVPDELLRKLRPKSKCRRQQVEWERRDDGALLGEVSLRNARPETGDRFDAAGVTAWFPVSSALRAGQQCRLRKNPPVPNRPRALAWCGYVNKCESKQLEPVATAIDECRPAAARNPPTPGRKKRSQKPPPNSSTITTRWFRRRCRHRGGGLVANALLLVVRGRVKENACARRISGLCNRLGWS